MAETLLLDQTATKAEKYEKPVEITRPAFGSDRTSVRFAMQRIEVVVITV